MRDALGIYYHPNPGDTHARVYVRQGLDGEVEFRLWQAEHPEVWEGHPWLSYRVIKDAASLYRSERDAKADPLRLYDLSVARALIMQEAKKRE